MTKQYNEEQFIEDFIDLIGELESSSDRNLVDYYSKLCASSNREPSDDLWIFESDMFDKGWDNKKLSDLFNSHGDSIISRLDNNSRGVGDYFLYKWTNKKFPLAGYTLIEDDQDIMMKYSYGWQRHKYGVLFLDQNGYDTKKFLNLVAKSFYEGEIVGYVLNMSKFRIELSKFKKYTSKFKRLPSINDGTIEIPYKKMADMMNMINFLETESDDEDEIDSEEIKDYIISSLSNYDNTSYDEKPDSIVCKFNP